VAEEETHKRQHVVTKAILRRFADPSSRKLEVYFRESGDVEFADPDGVCWIEHFVREDPEKAELLWGTYERRLTYFYAALDEIDFFKNERAVRTARSMLALHAARSYTARDIAGVAEALTKKKVVRDLVRHHRDELVGRIRSRSSFAIPMTPAMLIDEANRTVDRNASPLEVGGQLFRDRLFVHFREARRLMDAQPGLEIFAPANPHSEFAIGDDPVLIPSRNRDGRFGPLQRVGWFDAETFLMPFSPRHVIAVGPANRRFEMADDAVEWVNGHQLRQTREHLVARPGSGLAQWAANVTNEAFGSSTG
jgi:hypothetical protein